VKHVCPAMEPCTAFCARSMQSMESDALAATERIMYDGSMYLIETVTPFYLK